MQSIFKGEFISTPAELLQRLQQINAFVFDWDGVFNNGLKDESGSSTYNEIDSMGTNMLRFNHYLCHGRTPNTAVITGEQNHLAYTFAKREHFDAVYCGIKAKTQALQHFCRTHNILQSQVAFMFDDVLDFSVAQQCGLRIMVGRNANPLLIDFAKRNQLVDYITFNDGAHHAVREMTELLIGLSGKYDETMSNRAAFSPVYTDYLAQRNIPNAQLFTVKNGEIIAIDRH